jgi:hypothetical protein
LPKYSVPLEASEFRRQLLERGELTFANLLQFAWELGVVVLPLEDSAAFDGAFWRINGRNVIIMKQKTNSVDRLLHDLGHELFHAAKEPDRPDRTVIDEVDNLESNDPEEVDAANFASDLVLGGDANALVEEIATRANSHGPALKRATQEVAQKHGLRVGALANHLAWVLSRQADDAFDWWGPAMNLQEPLSDELLDARDLAFEKLIPPGDDDPDVELLFRALRSEVKA